MPTPQVIYSSTATQLKPRQNSFSRRKQAANLDLDSNPHYFQVMAWLLKLRFMTTDQIARVLDPPIKARAVYDLLRRMYDEKVITRFDMPFRRKWGRGMTYGAAIAIHCLDRAGAVFLAERLKTDRSEIDWKPRDNQKNSPLPHRLETNNVLVTMHGGARRLGWQFEIVQSEREIHKRGGHDWLTDPTTNARRPVKADAVCRLKLSTNESALISLELDMGTEGEKKIKRKLRLHRQHWLTGKYQKRHGTKSSRIPFVVADIRDPWLVNPMGEDDWKRRIGERVLLLKRWAQEEEIEQHFWFAPAYTLTAETIWQKPLWLRPKLAKPVPFISIIRAGSI